MTVVLNRLSFVGFGAMPRKMAARLRDASFSVIAFDIAHSGGELESFKLSESPQTLAQEVDAVLVCVPDDHALKQSTEGKGGALQGSRPRPVDGELQHGVARCLQGAR